MVLRNHQRLISEQVSYMNQGKVRNSPEMQIYGETCIRQPLLGPLKSGCLGKVIILLSTFIKQLQSKSGCSWQVFRFNFSCQCFINYNDLLE